MRRSIRLATLGLLLWLGSSSWLAAGTAAIFKVLPHYLDLQGRHALSPSLFERDAYQAILREHPERCSGLRFDVNWKAKPTTSTNLILRIELRSSKAEMGAPIIVERPVKGARVFRKWTGLVLDGEQYAHLGKLLAWRATLWEGDQLLASQQSFLW